MKLAVPAHDGSTSVSLTVSPQDPGVVFEKIVLDFGGYKPGYLHGEESPKTVKL